MTQEGTLLAPYRCIGTIQIFALAHLASFEAAAVPNTSTGSAPATPRGVEDGTVASASQKPLRSAGPALQSGELDPSRVTLVGKPLVRESRPATVVCSRLEAHRLRSVLARPTGRPRWSQWSPSCLQDSFTSSLMIPRNRTGHRREGQSKAAGSGSSSHEEMRGRTSDSTSS